MMNCPFCFSEIPESARKCRFCLEWLEDEHNQIKPAVEDEATIVGPLSNLTFKEPFQKTILKKLPFHYLVSVLIIASLLFFSIQLLMRRLGEKEVYLISFGAYAVQMVFSWAGLIWINSVIIRYIPNLMRLIDLDNNILIKKIEKGYNLMFHARNAILAGIFIGLVAAIGDYLIKPPFQTEMAGMIYAVFEFFDMFWAGAGVYSILVFALLIRKVGTFPMVQELKYSKSSGVGELGRLHLKTALLAIFPFAFGIIARAFGEWDWGLLTIMWYGGFALLIVFYLFFPLLNIHRMMVIDKVKHLDMLEKQLNHVFTEINKSPTSASLKRYFDLKQLEKSISDQSTWPFELKNIAGISLAIIFPILLTVLQIIFS
jgi:hypothetical protein